MTGLPARALGGAGALAAVLWTVPTHGDPRDVDVPRGGTLPAGLHGFHTRREAGVYARPSRAEEPVGRLVDGEGFAVTGVAHGDGCTRLFVSLGDGHWVCGDDGVLRADGLTPRVFGAPRAADGLPWDYAFTINPGTRVFPTAAAALAGEGEGAARWEAHWGFAVRQVTERNGVRVVETLDGQWLRRGDVFRAEPGRFLGGAFTALSAGGTVPFGWVVAPAGTRMWRTPEMGDQAGSTDPGAGRLARLASVRVLASRTVRGVAWARLDAGLWVPMAALRVFTPEAVPAEVNVAARERWIDVDLSQQILAAYEGANPVYATLVSTGGAGTETRPGVWRIWGKYAARTMDNTENTATAGHWRMGDVPYVQFFDQDRGLHGVYWHEDFGQPRSHGCVNLAPRDAAWLFGFTAPGLPSGWQSITPGAVDGAGVPRGVGTVVRVRGQTPPRT